MKITFLFLQGIGIQEILMIGMFILIFFGAKKIPDFMTGLGKGVRDFKNAASEAKQEIDAIKNDIPKIE